MTDIDDVKIKIICDKSEKEEREYNKQDFVDLITEILKQRDNEYDAVALLTKRADDLKQFLNHELDVATRKITQANWLTEDKKHFLLGQQEIIRRVLETMDRK
jgi:hypothetical protein